MLRVFLRFALNYRSIQGRCLVGLFCLAGYMIYVDGIECPSILPIQYNNCKCCYGIFRNKMSWDDAKKRCNSLGAHLLWIENSEEQAFLDMIAQSSKNWYDENGYFWMGLRRVSSSTRPGGPFRWHHDGSTLNMASDYQNWGTGGPPSKPNLTRPDGDGDCVHIGQPRTGQWNDDRCYINKNYICKMCEFSTEQCRCSPWSWTRLCYGPCNQRYKIGTRNCTPRGCDTTRTTRPCQDSTDKAC